MNMHKKKISYFFIMFTLITMLSSCSANRTATVEHAREWLTDLDATTITVDLKEYTVELNEEFLSLLQLEEWKSKSGSRSQKVVATIYLYDQCEVYLHDNGTASVYYGYASRWEREYNLYAIPEDVAEVVVEHIVNNVHFK